MQVEPTKHFNQHRCLGMPTSLLLLRSRPSKLTLASYSLERPKRSVKFQVSAHLDTFLYSPSLQQSKQSGITSDAKPNIHHLRLLILLNDIHVLKYSPFLASSRRHPLSSPL